MTDFKDAHNAGAATNIVSHMVENIEHILVPEGAHLESMAKLMPAPNRIVACPSFTDVAGFSEYIESFKEDGSRIFVDDNKWRFDTVFDCHSKGKPAWGDHSASMRVEISNEWKRFCNYNGKPMSPAEFAEFLEDNTQWLSESDGHSAGDLLTMAQSFKIKLKGDIEVTESLHSGLKRLLITDDSTVRGTNDAGQEIAFPETLSFALRIFKNQDAYDTKVFLRTRHDDKQLQFTIKIPDTDTLEEQAFDNVIKAVAEATQLPTLKGSFR